MSLGESSGTIRTAVGNNHDQAFRVQLPQGLRNRNAADVVLPGDYILP
jgi:hypothetical protein